MNRPTHNLPRNLLALLVVAAASQAFAGDGRHYGSPPRASYSHSHYSYVDAHHGHYRGYPAHGYSYWAAGENLAWSSPSMSSGGAMRLWISSPPHLANLLSRQWHQIGISAVSVPRAPGVYGGRQVTIITADFGVRS